VVVAAVGPGDADRHRRDRMIDDQPGNLAGQTHRPGEADPGAGGLLDGRFVRQLRMRAAKHLRELLGVDFMVASDQSRDGLIADGVDQRLDHLCRRGLEEPADRFNRPDVGRVDILRRRRIQGGRLLGHRIDRRLFEVGGIRAVFGVNGGVLARGAGDGELVRAGAAHFARLGLDDHVLDATAFEDATVCIVHRHVRLVQALGVGVEAVRVFHHELARPQHAESRAELIAELRTDLVEVDRQLLVRADLVDRVEGEHLFSGRAQDVPAAVAVLEPAHGLAVVGVPAGLLPQLTRLKAGHQDLLGARPIHLLADDLDDLLQGPPSERQVGVRPAGDLADQAGPDHQLVAGDLRIGRNFLHRRDQHLTVSHVFHASKTS